MKLSALEPQTLTHAPGDRANPEHWREVVGKIGAEIAGALTPALERIVALTASGRIDRRGLRALRAEVGRARQIGIESQQLARLASGRLRQSHESVQLADMLRGVLAHREREARARGIAVNLPPALRAEVLVDAPLLFSLLNATLDWALDCARSAIELRIDVKEWPVHARLICHFAHRPVDQLDDGAATPDEVSRLDSMHWRLLQQTARSMGLPLERVIGSKGVELTIEFPRTVNGQSPEVVSVVEIDDEFAPSINTKAFAGSHVLVVAQRREVRVEVRDALRDMGLIVDFASSVLEAVDFCRDGLPHGIIVESVLCGERFDELRREIAAEAPQFVFIEIIEDSRAFELPCLAEPGMPRVRRDAIALSLPSALVCELSRGA